MTEFHSLTVDHHPPAQYQPGPILAQELSGAEHITNERTTE